MKIRIIQNLNHKGKSGKINDQWQNKNKHITLCTLTQTVCKLSYIVWFKNQCFMSQTRLWFLYQCTTGAPISDQESIFNPLSTLQSRKYTTFKASVRWLQVSYTYKYVYITTGHRLHNQLYNPVHTMYAIVLQLATVHVFILYTIATCV